MTDEGDFDDANENIFSDEDISYDSPPKRNRIISEEIMGEFIAWLAYYHSEIQMVVGLSRRDLERLVNEFEYFAGRHYDFTIGDWQYSLEQR